MSDHKWEMKQRKEQHEDVLEYRRVHLRMLEPEEIRRREYRRNKEVNLILLDLIIVNFI